MALPHNRANPADSHDYDEQPATQISLAARIPTPRNHGTSAETPPSARSDLWKRARKVAPNRSPNLPAQPLAQTALAKHKRKCTCGTTRATVVDEIAWTLAWKSAWKVAWKVAWKSYLRRRAAFHVATLISPHALCHTYTTPLKAGSAR